MKLLLLLFLLLKYGVSPLFASDRILIRVSEGDTLSSLLFSVGSIPLYRGIGAVEIHQVVFKPIYDKNLEVGQSVPILKSSIRFHENLINITDDLYDIRKRIVTLNDYKSYIENRTSSSKSLAKPAEELARSRPGKRDSILLENVEEKSSSSPLVKDFGLSASAGYRFLDKKITQGALETETKSNGQPFLKLDSSLGISWISFQSGLEIQPWLGGSEGLSTDYLIYINQYISHFRVSPFIGLKYEKSGFISKSQNTRIANASKSSIFDIGLRFAITTKIIIVSTYELGLNTSFERQNSELSHKGVFVNTDWLFLPDWSLNLVFRQSNVKDVKGLELSNTSLSLGLSYSL
jgi:hypothetical protein